MIITAVDPGGTTGYARFKHDTPVAVGTLKFGEEVFDFIAHEFTDLWVVEDYKIRVGTAARGYDHAWNSGEALQVIGAIKYHSRRQGLPEPVLQQPSIKPIGYKLLGAEYKKGKSGMHVMDAMAHARYYLHKNGGKL